MSRKAPKKKSRLLHRVYAVIIILVGVLILTLAVLALFHTKRIAIEGTQYSSPDAVEEWMRGDKGAVNTLYLVGKYNLGNPDLMPFMESMKVSLKNPWTVKLTVTEKKLIGSIQTEEGYVCFDKDGLVVYISPAPVEGVPLIEGMEVKKASLYEILDVKDETVFQRILDATQMLKKCSLTADRILSDGKNVTLYFGGICAQLGSTELKNKILQLPAILEKLSGQEGTLKMEHYTTNSKYISFQKNVPPTEAEADGNQDSVDQNTDEEDGGDGEEDGYDNDNPDGEDDWDDSDDGYDDSGSGEDYDDEDDDDYNNGGE